MHPSTIVSLLAAVLASALPCRAQDEAAAAPKAGPVIAYEEAYPAQKSFDRPLFVAFHATDPESAYVVTQPGHVFRIPRDGNKGARAVFLDLTERVFIGHFEEGLLGFQFDPDYADNGLVYAYWTEKIDAREGPMAGGRKRKSDRQSVISRFKVEQAEDGVAVDPASELRLLEVFQPFGNHNGGTILFGPDGMLYIALGDGGAANDPYANSESLEMLLGKVLRIDVRGATADAPYKIPADNPFAATENARGEIWAYGLRNVWRMAFDRETGELWAGDVGQNRIEEVVHITKGGFYGWNTYEGTEEFKLRRSRSPTPEGHIPPIAEYSHGEGLSITGGHVYRGAGIPGLRGFFVYGDFMTRRMWACRADGEGDHHEVVTLEPAPFQPSSFAEEPDGELLMTCFVGNAGKIGKVFRLVPGEIGGRAGSPLPLNHPPGLPFPALVRTTTLMLSVIVHGSAIGAAVVIGAYPHDHERQAPRVEIQMTVASALSAESTPESLDPVLQVLPEASPPPADLPVDPILPERELYRAVLEDPEPVPPPAPRPSLARIRPLVVAEPPVEPFQPETEAPVPEPPAPASVRVSASPRADNRGPDYPEHERVLGREGTVLVTAKVDEYGVVIDVVLTRPSRYAGFNRAALAAVRKWRFVPGTIDGAPIRDEVDVPVVFQLEDIRK